MPYNIMEIDGIPPINNRLPVDIMSTPHDIGGAQHTGKLIDSQIPTFIMRDDEHQLDPHTMLIDGRNISVDGAKLDTVELGAEVNNLMDQQASSLIAGTHSSWHTHDDWYYRKAELLQPGQSSISWLNIIGTPTEYNAKPHIHDDLYYTETEIDTLLNTKSDITHLHSDIYYTETEIDTLLNTKSDISHLHDDRYYTETEVNNLLDTKSNITHLHDDRYYTEIEVNNLLDTKSNITHLHDDRYYTESEVDNLLDTKSIITHLHDDRYYTESESDTLLNNGLNTKSDISHIHDDIYYTETEINSLLNTKSDEGHIHDSRYYTETEIDTTISNYYSKSEMDTIITAIETFGIKSSVENISALPATETENAIYIVRETVGEDYEGFYKYNSGWVFLARNTGNTETFHNEIQGLNDGDYKHLTSLEYGQLTGGGDTTIHRHDGIYYSETEIDIILNNKAETIHEHNNLYYTELETDNLLDNKSNNSHLHDDRYYTEDELDILFNTKSDISHLHDDRYFTETELVSLLLNKSDSTHLHNDIYYTETEINNLLDTKSNISHLHDDRYYTEIEIDTILNSKSDISHLHDDRYFTESEITSNYFNKNQLNTGQLDSRYYTETEINNFLNGKANTIHEHGDLYYEKSHIDQMASIYSLSVHTHDDRYYQQTEVNGLLAFKADSIHTHDDRYFTESELLAESGISGASKIGVSLIGGLTATNVQDALQQLKTTVASSANTLDEVYHEGQEINADLGPVKINATDKAPIQITNMSSAPGNTAAGQMAIIDNDLYIFNIDKNKWLTPSKTLSFGRSGSADGHMLTISGVKYYDSGYKMAKAGTIIGLTLSSTSSTQNKKVYIRINGAYSNTLYTNGNGEILDNGLNIDFNQDDLIAIQVSSSGYKLSDVVAVMEFSWRK